MNKAIKRVVKDIKEINKNPIENVYYEPDEDNVMRGYVMICGVKDTPYYFTVIISLHLISQINIRLSHQR